MGVATFRKVGDGSSGSAAAAAGLWARRSHAASRMIGVSSSGSLCHDDEVVRVIESGCALCLGLSRRSTGQANASLSKNHVARLDWPERPGGRYRVQNFAGWDRSKLERLTELQSRTIEGVGMVLSTPASPEEKVAEADALLRHYLELKNELTEAKASTVR